MQVKPSPTSPKIKKPDTEKNKGLAQTVKITVLAVVFGFLSGVLGEIYINTYLSTPFELPFIGQIQLAEPYAPNRELIIRRENNSTSNMSEDEIVSLAPGLVSIYELKDNSEENGPAAIYQVEEQLGHGIFLSNDGWIITDRAVIPTKGDYVVINNEGQIGQLESILFDPASDFVLIKSDLASSHIATLAKSEDVSLGQNANLLALNASQIARHLTLKGTKITSLDSSLLSGTSQTSEHLANHWQIDSNFSDHYSGAAVFNDRGELLGLINIKNNNSLILPAYYLQTIIRNLGHLEIIERNTLGVHYLPVHSAETSFLQTENFGSYLITSTQREEAVTTGSPADKVGLKEGDLIIKINDENMSEMRQLNQIIQELEPAAQVTLTIIRNKEEQKIEVTLE